jgi:microcystin-dependent protein
MASKRTTVGDTKFSMVGIDHLGWLICDGRTLNIADYYFLYQVLKSSFGGNATTFNLPNPAGRVLGVIGTGAGLTARAAGTAVGEETHVLTIPEMPTHNHTITDPGHTHTGTTDPAGFGTNSLSVVDSTFAVHTSTDVADNNSNHTHTFTTNSSTTGITINNTGGSQAHNNMQPTLFIGNLFIYCGITSAGSYPYTSGTNIY